MRNTILGEKPEGNRPHKKSKRTWKNHITIDLKEIMYKGVD
jgi:hypothetical protein